MKNFPSEEAPKKDTRDRNEYKREYYERNKERLNKYAREYYHKNKDKFKRVNRSILSVEKVDQTPFSVLQQAKTKPNGTSAVRWRIELRRRAAKRRDEMWDWGLPKL